MIKTRFAPSPTGLFHAGSYRTALFSYIFALQNKGHFVLRIEDTDKERSKKEFEENIIESLIWLGLKYDEFYRQSERTEVYKKYIQKMIDSGHAFISTEENSGDDSIKKRKEVIRFKNPNKKIKFNDLIRGEIEFDTTELGDFVIAKSMDEPIFHLVVVIDDFEMGISHIIRGEDHISNTPRQILIQEAIGAPTPKYAHLPLLLAKDRSKLSKRHGAVSMTVYRDMGYLPDALINYMALLGWNPGDDTEIMSFDQILDKFRLEKVQKSGAIFDEEKLKWINKEHINKIDDQKFFDIIEERMNNLLSFKKISSKIDSSLLKRAISTIRERLMVFGEFDSNIIAGEYDFMIKNPDFDKESVEKIIWKEDSAENTKKHLKNIIDIISEISDKDFSKEKIKEILWPYAEKEGKGNVLWPMRYLLSGKEKSPDPFSLAYILGKEKTLERLNSVLQLMGV